MFEIRQVRSPQGRKTLHAERRTYLDLVAQGVSTAEACRIVGINRRTGHRWRHGRASQAGRKAPRQPPALRRPRAGS
ncbi:helix-turn-helix domain-containing protein [Nonomuraea sp. NPDC052129]|uniref:helix-turn-helix domain-containing protein n=1 Tax=Nonomuraea sp. NPDC052129 TaxID=3154651 RepID=UPI0034406DF6